jgi:hypothetical protein
MSAAYSIRGTHEGVAEGARYLPVTAAVMAVAVGWWWWWWCWLERKKKSSAGEEQEILILQTYARTPEQEQRIISNERHTAQ